MTRGAWLRLLGAATEPEATGQRLRAALRHAPIYVFEQDRELRYTWLSRAPEGMSLDDILGRTDAELLDDPAQSDALSLVKRRVLETGLPERHEMEISMRGMWRNMDFTLEPVRDDQGLIIGLTGVAMDISSQAQAQRLIEEWQWRFESAVRASRHVVYDRDLATGQVLWGGSVKRVLRHREADLATMDAWRDLVHPDDRPFFDETLERARLARASFQHVYRVRAGTGWIDVEDQGSFVHQEGNHAERMVGSIADVTSRREAERDLQHQSHVTRTLTENTASALLLLDVHGRPTFANQATATLSGYTLPELVGRSVHELLHAGGTEGGASPANACPVGRAIANGRPLRGHEEVLARKDGTLLFGSISVAPLERDGRFAGSVMEVRDVTPQKMAEQQLRSLNETLEQRVDERTRVAEQQAAQLRALATELTQAELRERRRLARSLHDHLQQNLVAAKLQLEMARAAVTGDRPAAAIQRADVLLNEAVECSRTLAVELSPPILSDAGLAASLEWLGRWMGEKHGLQVKVVAHRGLDPSAEEMKVLLFDTARELLFNVVKHARTNVARLTLEPGPEEGTLSMAVTDQGSGFDPASFQKALGQVRGFGLFNIRQRLEILGGRLEVSSKPGKGATLRITVPVKVEAPRADMAAAMTMAMTPSEPEAVSGDGMGGAARRKPVPPGRAIRVLVADDHQIVRQGLIGLLEAEPDIVVVGEAAHGLEAVERSRLLRPDVVVMDVNMPKMNGIEATRHIARAHPHVAVIALSLYRQGDMAQTLQEAGASAYLTKDGPSDELIRAIRTARSGPLAPRPAGGVTHDTGS